MDGTYKKTTNQHHHPTSSAAATLTVPQEIEQFFQKETLPLPPLDTATLNSLHHIKNFDFLWSSRKGTTLDGMNLRPYINEFNHPQHPDDYILIGQFPGAKETPSTNQVIVFIVAKGPLVYMAQMRWSEYEKNPDHTTQFKTYIEWRFKNYNDIQKKLEELNHSKTPLPHNKRLLVVESNFEPEISGCAWIETNTPFDGNTAWHKPMPGTTTLGQAIKLIEQHKKQS